MLHEVNGIVPRIDETAYVAPTATVIGRVSVADMASIWYGAVLRGDMEPLAIGSRTNIQDLTVCHTDAGFPVTVGSGVTVGHRCILHGCTIGDDCLIGMGSIVMNGAVVGRGSVVAAGATVLEHQVIPPCSLVVGVPGKVRKTFPEQERLVLNRKAAEIYLDLAAAHRKTARPCQ